MEMLRFATAGSVDDGKSTLIGRLLLDTKQIFEDQLEAVERTSRDRGFDYTNLALLTDGLRAEREQGITIDVAYRYFATPRRKFIIADTPGPRAVHAQHGHRRVDRRPRARAHRRAQGRARAVAPPRGDRVAAAGASTSCCASTRWTSSTTTRTASTRSATSSPTSRPSSTIDDLTFIPVSALHGDNVITHSPNMPWYEGPTLLHHLEHVYIGSDRNLIDARFPVQYVIRPMSHEHHDYRGYAGQVASGIFRPGDEVMVLPSGFTTTIAGIDRYGGRGRGGVPADVGDHAPRRRPRHQPRRHDLPAPQRADRHPGRRRDGLLVQRAAAAGGRDLRRSSTRPAPPRRASRTCTTGSTSTRSTATRASSTLGDERHGPGLAAHRPCRSSSTSTAATASPAASSSSTRARTRPSARAWSSAPIRVADERAARARTSSGTTSAVPRAERWAATGLQGATVWLTGLSGSGKSTIAGGARPAGSSTAASPPTRSTATTSATASTATSASPPPTGPRTCAGSARWRACSPTPGSWSLVP